MSSALQQGVTLPKFTLAQREVLNPYNFQFYLIHGETEAGPWLKVGLNDCEYILGFVPPVTERSTASELSVVALRGETNERSKTNQEDQV